MKFSKRETIYQACQLRRRSQFCGWEENISVPVALTSLCNQNACLMRAAIVSVTKRAERVQLMKAGYLS
ncbi:Histidinol-phosphate aminotransferase [Dirofilaria immitis]